MSRINTDKITVSMDAFGPVSGVFGVIRSPSGTISAANDSRPPDVMPHDTPIPGFNDIDDWPVPLVEPVQIEGCGVYRDGGPRGGTYYVELSDAAKNRFPFFFDRFLGRLCYGTLDDTDDAAFLKPGSEFETQAFALLDSLAITSSEFAELRERLDHAKNWAVTSSDGRNPRQRRMEPGA